MTPLTYTMQDMRTVLQLRDLCRLRRYLTHLEAHGFPPRLPHVPGQRALWSKPAVDAWLANWGTPQAAAPQPVADARQLYEARYQGRA